MGDIIVSLTDLGRQMEAQALLYGYGFSIDYFVVGSGGADPANPTLALPLDLTVTALPGQFFGPKPIDVAQLITSTCDQWTCILQPGEGVGQISNFGLIATNVYVPASSVLLAPESVYVGTSVKTFTSAFVNFPIPNEITIPSHGFTNGNAVVLNSTSTLPGGLNNTYIYYVIYIDADTLSLSTTPNGSAITLQTQGSGTMSITLSTDYTFTYPNHGFKNGDLMNLITTNTLPGGLISGQNYYLINATTNTFQLSPTSNGPVATLTTSGVGVLTVTDLNTVPPNAPVVGSTFLYALTNFPASYKLSQSRQTYYVTLQT